MAVEADNDIRPRVTLFCSPAENIGQTTTVLNTALILAEAGRRVLVVDHGAAGIGAARYLGALPGHRCETPPAQDRVPGTDLPRPTVWSLAPQGRPVRLDLISARRPTDLADLPVRQGGTAAGRASFAEYDDVLIDAPVPRSADDRAVLAPLPHVLAVCFTLNSWLIESAAALARALRKRATGRLGVLAVGLKADSRTHDQLRIARALIRDSFEGFSDGAGAHYVEFPYDPLYTQSDTLAVYEERPSASGGGDPVAGGEGLRPGFLRLADELSRTRPMDLRRVTLLHTPRHLAWAEWIETQLQARGVRVRRFGYGLYKGEPPLPGGMLVALSPLGVAPEQTDLLATLSHPDVRMVLVDEEPLPRGLSHHEQIVLRRLTEPEALLRLRRGLHLPPAGELPVALSRFPKLPPCNNLHPRNPDFVGRDEVFEGIRSMLAAAERARGHGVLSGSPGIGKSQLALEYCHRFPGDHEVVWWVRADSAGAARRSLTRLAERLGVPTVGDVPRRVIEHLRSAAVGPWLLIYDDVRDPEILFDTHLVPRGGDGGHVLLTARRSVGLSVPHQLDVPAFSEVESRALLTTRVRGLTTEHAERLSRTVAHVPLRVKLAAAWVEVRAALLTSLNRPRKDAVDKAVAEFADAFVSQQQELLTLHKEVSPSRVVLEVALRALRQSPGSEAWGHERGDSTVTRWLLECCALLTGPGASLQLLRSPQMQAALARRTADVNGDTPDTAISDDLMVDVALWAMARYGLIEVDFARQERPVRQHQVLRDAVLERMSAAERQQREHELRAVVAGFTQVEPRGRALAEFSDQQARQLTALRIWEDPRPEVRQRLNEHLGNLARTRDELRLREVLELGGRAHKHWQEDEPSAEYLRLHTVMASALRVLGEYAEASRHARIALRGYRSAFGVNHPRTLLSADAYGALLRADGHFADALTQGNHVYQRMRELLGPDHRTTAQAEHNLALCEALMGNVASALDRLQGQLNRRRAIGGPDDPAAWTVLVPLAAAQRALGQDRESYDLLKQFVSRKSGEAGTGVPYSEMARVETGLAVCERRLGNPTGAWERDGRVLRECLRLFGSSSPVTVRTRFSFASDLHALGRQEEALEQSALCLKALDGSMGTDHPYTHLARIRHAVHEREAGRVAVALEWGGHAYRRLEARLGATHPWTLAAASGLAGTLVADGAYDDAEWLEEQALNGFEELRMTQHPSRALIAANLVDTRAHLDTGRPAPGVRRGDVDLELPGV
ncbi:FxSxx-COOH system tetratricopeptide repeat protein [Streptomyces sp. NPDC059816]|uniref:FxSxx-COOH system tetratricopeptide repeat protein n=1 Tax=Streptomyces sp. NPDC059816 TaxID=3346960 RepID=UPI003653DC04